MDTKTESVQCVYNADKELVALIKRDDKSKKVLVYLTNEARPEEIGKLITGEDLGI